jgi:hypothetical protein
MRERQRLLIAFGEVVDTDLERAAVVLAYEAGLVPPRTANAA